MEAKKNSEFEMNSLFLKKPGHIIRYGNYWILFFFLILFGLALLVPYNHVLEGEVLVSSKEPPAQVRAGSSGEIGKIFFSPGDNVKPKDVLAIIANPASYSDVKYLKEQLVRQHQIRDLEALSNIFPPELEVGPEPQFQYLKMIEALQLQILKEAFDEEKNLLVHGIRQEKNKKEQLKIQKEQIINAEGNLWLAEANFLRYQNLFEKGVVSKLDLENIEKELIKEKESVQNHQNELQELESEFSEIINQTSLVRNSEIGEGKINETEVWGSQKELWNAISVWEEKYLLKSTIHGTLHFLDVWGPNQSVSKDDVVFKISSEKNESFVGKSSFQTRFVGRIEAGTRALIRLDSYPDSEWGIVEGTVSSASIFLDGIEKSRQIVYFHIPQLKTSSGRKIPFEQEMIGQVEVLLKKATVIDRLINF